MQLHATTSKTKPYLTPQHKYSQNHHCLLSDKTEKNTIINPLFFLTLVSIAKTDYNHINV